MKAARPRRHSHPPGTFYYYNNWDFNALGTIFRQRTGLDIFEAFERRIARPLDMADFEASDGWYADGTESIHPYYGPTTHRVLVAAWQPGAYNFNRGWGGRALSFDRTGRMHVRMAILGVGEDGRMTSGPVYAYSDDLGQSFRAADGKPLKLPLTVNPIPSHDGNTSSGPLKTRYDLWASLVKVVP